MSDPTIVTLAGDYADTLGEEFDPHFAIEAIQDGRERCRKLIPAHFADATVTVPEVAAWVRRLVESAIMRRRTSAITLSTGPSLLLLGVTGVGKTHEAYGAARAMAETGVGCRWVFTTAADAYATMRPRSGVDPEDEMRRFMRAQLLMLDDLGAEKSTDWTEEINYRLINYRYEHELPTLVTSNVRPAQLADKLGERVISRLAEMAERVVMQGHDRRRGARPSCRGLSDNDRDDEREAS